LNYLFALPRDSYTLDGSSPLVAVAESSFWASKMVARGGFADGLIPIHGFAGDSGKQFGKSMSEDISQQWSG
jgi:hypothetical protein